MAADSSVLGTHAEERERLRRQHELWLEVRRHDLARDSLAPTGFDLAWSRWLAMVLPELDPLLDLLSRSLRPGGRFAAAVMVRASSEASSTASAATSEGSPKRRSGVSATNSAMRASRSGPLPSSGSHMGVRIAAGEIELQRMLRLCSAQWRATLRV